MEGKLQADSHAMKFISFFVIAVHCSLIFWMWLNSEHPVPQQKPVRLVAKTVHLNPQKNLKKFIQKKENFEEVLLNSSQEIASRTEEPINPLPKIEKNSTTKATPQKEIKISKKKDEKKQVTKPSSPAPKNDQINQKKKTPPKPNKIAEKKPIDLKKKALVSQAQERIAKIEGTKSRITPSSRQELRVPEYHPKATFSHEESLSFGELSYRDELALSLKRLLKLPERGKVRLKLTITNTGKILKIAITESESNLNKQTLEKVLPTLPLPDYGELFGGKGEHTFSITLTSDL